MGRASIIEAYIQQLLAWDQPITPDVLNTIAQELGITAGELAAIKLKVQNHLERSRSYRDVDNFNSAIDELVQASNLDPVNADVLNALAELYYQRYQKESNLLDRQQTRLIANRCVELYPNDKDALALLKRLKRKAGYHTGSRQQRPPIFALIDQFQQSTNPKHLLELAQATLVTVRNLASDTRRPTVSKLAVLVGGMATVGVVFIGGNRLPGGVRPTPKAINSSFLSAKGAVDLDAVDDLLSVPVFDPGPNIPVTFQYPGLFLEPRLSRLGEYDGADYYKLHGLLINDSGQEVRKLDLKLELLDGDGVPIATINQTTISNNSIRPGDIQPFELFHKITPNLIQVRVSVTDIEQVVDNKPYNPPIPNNFSLGSWLPEGHHSQLISRGEDMTTVD
ncbi:MAG: hypothetical protein AAF821_17330 [Cyanobacteria bacterium P01_D01_bin.156]